MNAVAPDVLKTLKTLLRENEAPFFSDEELELHYVRNGQNLQATLYDCLIIKSDNTTLSISGLSLADTSAYFRRLAKRYRPNNSGILRG